MVGQHAEGQAVHDWEIYWWETGSAGEIEGITLTNRGSGYVAPPTVHFIGSGYGAQATATIVTDPANPRFGQIDQITLNSKGQGYFGETIVELRGGLGNESLFLNAQAYDIDGEVNQIEFLSNGQLVASDLTEPFAIQETFSVGYYEFIALAKDDAGNIVASEPSRVNVSTIRGAAPSGFIIYPLPIIALQSYQTMGQDYFWPFVRNYSELILQQESTLGNQVESFSLASNSFIHLSARATDSDGSIKDVTFYLNNKYLGKAERYHDSHHYFLPVDLSDFGEQPVYRIDTMIRDQADNVVIPNNPIYLNVLSATGSRPDIEIVMPSPNANTIPKFSMGGQVSLVVDATPKEGTLDQVSLFANGRFIGDANLQNTANYGPQRYALNWNPENPGLYTLTAAVRDNMGAIIFTEKGSVIEILEDKYEIISNIEILPEEETEVSNNAVSRGSSLIANAEFLNPNGKPILLDGVKFYLNGQLLINDFNQSTQTSPPYTIKFTPPTLPDRFVNSPQSWEIIARGQTIPFWSETLEEYVEYNGTAIEYGTIVGVTEMPELHLSPIQGINRYREIDNGINLSLSVTASGDEEVLQQIGDVVMYGNGIEISSGNATENVNAFGNLESITYRYEWIVDHEKYAKENGRVSLIALATLNGDPTGTGSIPVVATNTETIMITYNGSNSVPSLFSRVTGDTLTPQDMEMLQEQANEISSETGTADESIEVLLNLVTHSAKLSQRVDITAAYHVTMGQWHDSYSEYQAHLDEFIPDDPSGDDTWLREYIDYLLTSPDESFLARFGIVPYLVGDETKKDNINFMNNRMNFTDQMIQNKYGKPSTFAQAFQGSTRMLKYWSTFEPEYWEVDFANGTPFQDSPQRRDTVFAGATGYEAGECAVDLVYNLSKEMLFEGGLPYILGTENKRRLYRIVSYYFLYYGENVSEIDNKEIEYLATLDEADALRNILSDYRWTSQSNRIWQNSRTLNWGQWKEEKWFGSFMDKYFPWVFHSELGWVYIEGTTQKGFWFYSSKQNEWYWTGAQYFRGDNNERQAFAQGKNTWVWFYYHDDGKISLFYEDKESGLYDVLNPEEY